MVKKVSDVVIGVAANNRTWIATIFVALFVAIPPTILAWRNSEKADQIHTLVNSNLSTVKADLALANQRIEAAVKADLAVANQRIEDLIKMVTQLQQLRDAEVAERASDAKVQDGKKK